MMLSRWGGFPMGSGLLEVLLIGLLAAGLIAIIVVVWAISRSSNKQGSPAGQPAKDSALEILRERYARGEVTREEFEAMRRDLGA